MPTTAITGPTTVRELLFDERSDAEVAVALTATSPPGSMVARQLSRQRHLPRTAYRLLDSRIAALAVEFLDHDVGGIVLSGLRTCRDLVRAAEESRAHPGDEVVVHLAGPLRREATEKPYVEVLVDGTPVGRVTFDLQVALELGETGVVVRDEHMTSLDCTVCALEITFTVDGWVQPLVTRRLSVPVRLTLDPPVAIPMGPSVPAARPPVPPPRDGRADRSGVRPR
jgi:hypothetical protein